MASTFKWRQAYIAADDSGKDSTFARENCEDFVEVNPVRDLNNLVTLVMC